MKAFFSDIPGVIPLVRSALKPALQPVPNYHSLFSFVSLIVDTMFASPLYYPSPPAWQINKDELTSLIFLNASSVLGTSSRETMILRKHTHRKETIALST